MNENEDHNYGDNFQQKSKYTRENLPRHRLDWSTKPGTYKVYKDAISNIKLPKVDISSKKTPFWKIIKNRHSSRKFNQNSITMEDISYLLYAMSGITRDLPQFQFRTVPSAGGLFPIEVYPVINDVEGLKMGIYHFNIKDFELELLKKGDFRKQVADGCLGQRMAYKSAVNFIMTAVIKRSQWKYLQRCYRYIYLDCGHIGQNLYLAAEALELGICTIGAIFDDELNNLLGLDGKNETAVYVGVVGQKYKR